MRDFVRGARKALIDLYPKGVSLLWLAPLVMTLVILPELAQHVVEVRLGMFDSREAFIALQADPTRMAFGYVKIAGLVLTMLASARFWAARSAGRFWYDVRDIAWKRLALGLLVFGGIPAIPELALNQLGRPATDALGIGLSILLLPMLFVMLAGVFGDRDTPLRDIVVRGWPWLILTAILLVAGFVPASWLHSMNHQWALGAGPVLLWALMIFDSILVGLIGALVGTALWLGYDGFVRWLRPA